MHILFNRDDPDTFKDVIRYCKMCNKGKNLTNDNFDFNLTDMFKLSQVCKQCKIVQNLDKI